MRLVLVHGRAQEGKDAFQLQRVWLEALDCGLAQASLTGVESHEVVFPYYGDTLAHAVNEIKSASAGNLAVAKGAGVLDASVRRTIDELQVEMMRANGQLVEQDAIATSKGWENTALAHRFARSVDPTLLGKELIHRFTEDVAIYLTYPAVAQRIDDIVAAAIGTEQCVVVAHSLGSIVAYRVLRALGRSANVQRLVTLGSPLGLSTIRRLMSPPARTFPAGVVSWLNARDPKDIVALYALDSETWNLNPAIENHDGVNNHMDNHHNISGYLDDVRVAAAIHEALHSS